MSMLALGRTSSGTGTHNYEEKGSALKKIAFGIFTIRHRVLIMTPKLAKMIIFFWDLSSLARRVAASSMQQGHAAQAGFLKHMVLLTASGFILNFRVRL